MGRPMQQQDYILDIIRQAVEFIRQAVGKNNTDEREDDMRRLKRTARQLVGIDIEAAESLTLQSLKISLMTRDGLDIAKTMILGGLLKSFSDRLETGPRQTEAREKAKNLLLMAANASNDPLPIELLLALQDICPPDELPEHVVEWLEAMRDDGA